MKIKKLNNVIVKPIKYDNKTSLPVKGEDLISNAYANIFCLAKKKSGKTTVIYRMIQKCIDKNTTVFIFCSTVKRDPAYKKMTDYLERKNIEYETFTSLTDDDGNNILENIIDELKANGNDSDETTEEDEQEKPKEKKTFNIFEIDKPPEKKVYIRKPKYLTPKYLFIFDDLGTILKHKAIDQLLKTNRHFRARVIISSQYLNDISIASRLQLDYLFIFKGMPLNKLAETYRDIDLSIDFNQFLHMYNLATSEKFNFFYIDIRGETFRRNFDLELVPEEQVESESDVGDASAHITEMF